MTDALIGPVRWKVADPEPLRKLLWFCLDPQKNTWVEPMRCERLDNADEIMAKALVTIAEHCGAAGEVRFGDDPTLYTLRRVELRTNGEIEKTLTFTPTLVTIDPHLVAKLFTHVSLRSTLDPHGVIDRHFIRGTTLQHALSAGEKMAKLAGTNAGYIILEDDHWYLLDRVEVYYDGVFQRVFVVDVPGTPLDGE